MGADRVFVYKFDRTTQTLSPGNPPFVDFGPNTGPRHLVFSPDGRFLFVLTELSAEVRTFHWDAGNGHAQLIQVLPLDPPDFTGTRSGAEINVSHDGRFVYISNRARNVLEVYAVEKESGKLTHLQDIASGGDVPRSFGLDPSGRWLIAGNQTSKTLTVFSIDKATGKLASAGPPVPVDLIPVCFAFYQP